MSSKRKGCGIPPNILPVAVTNRFAKVFQTSESDVYLLNKRLIKKHDIYMCPKSKSTCPNDCEHKVPHEMIEEHLTNYCDECKLVTIYL